MSDELAVTIQPDSTCEVLTFDDYVDLTLQQVQHTAAAGRFVAKEGDLDYSIGVLTEQIESIRKVQRRFKEELRDDDKLPVDKRMKPLERIKLLERIGKMAAFVTMSVKELTKISQVAGDRKKQAEKPRALSFTPGEQIAVINSKTAS